MTTSQRRAAYETAIAALNVAFHAINMCEPTDEDIKANPVAIGEWQDELMMVESVMKAYRAKVNAL
jgi:hypothetical protein